MSKLKTHSGAKKRFSLTGAGKIKRNKAYRRHILTSKTQKQKRRLRQTALVHTTNEAAVKLLLPYA